MNRASYQRLNPNMSIHKTPKPKQATLALKSGEATVFAEITQSKLNLVLRHWPEMTTAKLLIAMLNGKSFKCGDIVASIVYK